MEVELRIVQGCPHASAAEVLLASVAGDAGRGDLIRVTVVEDEEHAGRLGFRGSPTFLVDGEDLFPSEGSVGLSCRVYPSSEGLVGTPTATELRAALFRACASRTTAADDRAQGAGAGPGR